MKRVTIGTLTGAALLFAAGSAQAQWSDNFDSYPLNSFLPGLGGWEEWDMSTATSATKVKDVAAGAAVRSAPHSIWVRNQSDTIYDWNKSNVAGIYDSGQWTFCGFIYKPVTTTGFVMDIPSFWIMLNKYKHSSTGYNNWSVEVDFSPLTGNFTIDIDSGNVTGPCVFDQWVELRAEIDLDSDLVEIFYDGSSVAMYQWNGGASGFGTGDTRIDTLDLFANGGLSPQSRVYWDDLSLQAGFNGCGTVACNSAPTNYCTAGTSADGCQATLSAAGTASAGGAGAFNLMASNVAGDKDGLFFAGTMGAQANQWGNGTSFQCVVPPVKRYGLLGKTGTAGLCDGAFTQELNSYWQANSNKNPGPGATVWAQLWYRDPANTSNQTTSLSDAITFTVCP